MQQREWCGKRWRPSTLCQEEKCLCAMDMHEQRQIKREATRKFSLLVQWSRRSLIRHSSSTLDTRKSQDHILTWWLLRNWRSKISVAEPKKCTEHNATERNVLLQCPCKEWPPASHTPYVWAPPANFGNVAAGPVGVSWAEALLLIQSLVSGTETPAKKSHCHRCRKPDQWANKCPEWARKSGLSSSSWYSQDCTNRHKSWYAIPSLPRTCSLTTKMKDKTFDWYEDCCHWTVTHTTAFQVLGGERRAPTPALSPMANLRMLMQDPLVWMFGFPVKPPKQCDLFLMPLWTSSEDDVIPGYSLPSPLLTAPWFLT